MNFIAENGDDYESDADSGDDGDAEEDSKLSLHWAFHLIAILSFQVNSYWNV